MAKVLIRWISALVLLVYGFAKINGSQFTVLDSELDKPMGQVSGFWLTWYYFGFSPIYGTLVAIAQIAGAILLTFRRTALLGALILLPILSNIVLIDVCYGIDPGATIVAALLLFSMLWIVSPKAKELMALLLPNTSAGERNSWTLWAARLSVLAVAFLFTYWVANYNNRLPTPLDGAWDVVRFQSDTPSPDMPRTIFFEHNRAYLTVFKFNHQRYEQHHFEVEPGKHHLSIWRHWLRKGDRVFDGSYELVKNDLSVVGEMTGFGRIEMQLKRRSQSRQ